MESMSRPVHRRKLSNAYSGVFSGHRQKSDGAPAVSVEEYDEIFSTSGSCSIPVLDLSSLEEESCDDLKPDYCKIFGGFRDHDIAVSYQDLVARDLARAPSSTSQSSSDLDDTSQQCSDALKQFNLSYHKISQRNKDGLDGTTHVTQLHAVPGFTCFIDESASQPNKETVKQKSSSTDNVNVNSRKRDFSDEQTSQSSVDFSKYQEEYLSDNRVFKTFEADNKSHPSKVLSSPESKKQNAPATNYVPSSTPAASQSKKGTEKQKPPATNNVTSAPPSASEQKKETEKQTPHVASQQTKRTEKQTPPATNNIPLAEPVASQPKQETEKQKPLVTNNVPSAPPAASHPKQETEKQKPPATNNVISAPPSASEQKKKQTPHVVSQQTKGTEKQTPPATNNIPLAAPVASQPKQETEKQKPLATNNVPSAPPAASHPKQETKKQKLPATNNVISAPPSASEQKKETEKQTPPATNNIPLAAPVASQPQQETEKQKPLVTDNVPSAPSAASHPKQETEKQTPPATNNVISAPPSASEQKKETEKKSPPATNNIPSSPPAASQPTNETKKQKSSVTNNDHPSEKVDIPEKQTSQIADESQCRPSQDEAFCDVRNLKEFQADFKSSSSKVSSSRATNLDNHKDHQKRSKTTNEELPPTCFDEELHVNPAAAALRKAIEKAQESIRIAKESVGRKKEGLRGFSSKSFKESLKAKVRVANVNAGEEPKEKDDKMKEWDHKNGSTVVFSDFADGEKLFGSKDVTKEIHGKVSERSPFILNNNKMVCNSKQVVDETENESIKDDERPDGFLVLESCEKKQGDSVSNNLIVCQKVETEKDISQTSDQNCYEKKFSEESFENCEKKQEDSVSNNLTVCQKVETKKEISETSDQSGCEKKLSEESFGLFLNNTQENVEQEHEEENVSSPERQQLKEDRGTESHSEEEKFYDVCEVEMINKAQTYAYSKETNENSSSDYDDTEENENVIDTEEGCKVDENDNNAESSQEIDDVSSSQQFQVEYKNAVEKEFFENISSDETESNKDDCEAKSDNVENCSVADVDFGQNDVQFASSSDTIHGMEIEVKEYKEREETFEKEENNVQRSHEETPEIRIEMDTGTPQEPKDACRQSEPSKAANDKEEKERERIKLAVERAIREARERAFAEVKQRVIADTQEKVTKAAIDKTSAQSKLKAERALVERATAEARQRALEKVMKTSQPRIQVNDTMQVYSTSQTNTESALRSKAKLEKHNRIMERAAKALAEKEKRDLLALREQAERHRLAEHLDADIKRWSTGKEGNLRALLSTLQYILGADSGWQPVSLTEIITTTAVKKAYRKATLCVHPDKLQQRGASIHQKYICEKVFDLLKAAWNRFNSEER